ncbi:MAG: ABC-type transport auxiliary lipoprotein family protein [Thermodesulfovibrionales bacterium]|nr:ABC-type transport auxiliary lipoprotein family protein [Thermodesulfovibrionales bacterium]
MYKILIFVFGILIFSCSTTTTKIYSINITQYPQESKKVKTDEALLLKVNSSMYFKQSYIIYRSSVYEMMQSQYAKWDTPPDDFLRHQITKAFMAKGLFKEVHQTKSSHVSKSFLLNVDIKDFSRYDDINTSYAVLILDVNLKDTLGNSIYNKEISLKQGIDDRSYLSLAKGMSVLMTNALQTITDDVENSLDRYLSKK